MLIYLLCTGSAVYEHRGPGEEHCPAWSRPPILTPVRWQTVSSWAAPVSDRGGGAGQVVDRLAALQCPADRSGLEDGRVIRLAPL
jgi:hypothetical protein